MFCRIVDTLLGAISGACLGLFFGIALGQLLAPTIDPKQKLAHEWYIMAILTYMFVSTVGGAMLGGVVGAACSRRMVVAEIIGLLAGLTCGCLFWAVGLDPRWDSYSGARIICGTITGGMAGVVVGAFVKRKPET